MSTKSIIIKWGLIGGIVTIIMSLLSYLLGLSDSKIMQYIGVILMIAIIVLALFEYRDKLNSGFASFGDLVKVGLLIGLIIAIISAVWSFIYLSFIDTEFIARTLLKTEIALESKGISDREIKNAMEIAGKITNPLYMSIMGIASTLIISGIISFVSALIIKNEKPFADLDVDQS